MGSTYSITKKKTKVLVWKLTSIIPIFQETEAGDLYELDASTDYRVSPCLRKKRGMEGKKKGGHTEDTAWDLETNIK